MDLTLVIVAVDDLAPATAFWQALTGWDVIEDAPGVYAELRTPTGLRFGLYATDRYVGNLGPESGAPVEPGLQRTELYLAVDDAAATLARAVALGADLLVAPVAKPWGDVVGYAAAPGGFVLAVAQAG